MNISKNVIARSETTKQSQLLLQKRDCFAALAMTKWVFGSCLVFLAAMTLLAGCGGYSNQSLYSQDIKTVYVEMFENTTFRRDIEYELTDAIAKRIEAETPYKIVSDRSRADTIISGKITSLSASTLSLEPETGRAIENQAEVIANFSWKNLRTGEYLVENTDVEAAAGYVEFQEQGFGNAAKVAVSRLAERIVELMQIEW